jgi:hypothetical protein
MPVEESNNSPLGKTGITEKVSPDPVTVGTLFSMVLPFSYVTTGEEYSNPDGGSLFTFMVITTDVLPPTGQAARQPARLL